MRTVNRETNLPLNKQARSTHNNPSVAAQEALCGHSSAREDKLLPMADYPSF